jgi:hypothetical protein
VEHEEDEQTRAKRDSKPNQDFAAGLERLPWRAGGKHEEPHQWNDISLQQHTQDAHLPHRRSDLFQSQEKTASAAVISLRKLGVFVEQ